MTARCSGRVLLLPALAIAMVLAGCGSSTSASELATANGVQLGPSVVARGSEATTAVAHCRVDGAAWQACVSPFLAFGLTAGPHQIDVEAAHGGINLLRRPAARTGDRVALVAFANTASGSARASVRFTIAGARPGGSVALTGVAPGARLRGLVPVGARVRQGGSRIVLVDYYVDGQVVASAASAPWSALIDASRLAPGPHSLRVVAVSLDRRRRASGVTALTVLPTRITIPADAARGAIQAAVDALGPAGGTLRLPAGQFNVSDLKIGSNVRLIGAGSDKTVLVAPQGPYDEAVEVTGENVLISDLAIDGRGSGSTPDKSSAIFVHDSDDVVLRRLSLVHLKGYGVYVFGHNRRISLQASTLDGDGRARSGLAEWAGDASSGDISVVRCVIRNMQEYGMAFQSYLDGSTWPDPRALAYGNDVSQIHDPTIHDGTIEIGIWITGDDGAALDNNVRHTGWDGIETVVNSTNATIAGNVVRDTRTGIYVENVTHEALIEQNDIADVSVAGIDLEPPHGGPASGHQIIQFNRIVGAGKFGIGSGPGTLGSRITSNQVLDSGNMAILLQGTTGYVVEGNDLRDRRRPAQQQWCVYDPQSAGATSGNIVRGNDCTGSLNGGSDELSRYSARRGSTP